MSELVSLPKETVMTLIDMALTGDAGMSGWMDDEEVVLLRSAAEAIGMDPNEATPRNFRCKYRGAHRMGTWYTPHSALWVGRQARRCEDCGGAHEERPTAESFEERARFITDLRVRRILSPEEADRLMAVAKAEAAPPQSGEER